MQRIAFIIFVIAFVVGWWFWRQPRLTDIGPRMISNQTSQPLALTGNHFSAPLKVHLGEPFNQDLPATVVDARHAYVRLPDALHLPSDSDSRDVSVTVGYSHRMLTVVNDEAFVELRQLTLSPDAHTAYALSATNDTLYAVDLATRSVHTQTVGDGPQAMQTWHDRQGHDWLVVIHYYLPFMWLIPLPGNPEKQKEYGIPRGASGFAIDGQRAYVAGQVDDDLWAIDLDIGTPMWKIKVRPNPHAVTTCSGLVVVGSLQTGEIQILKQSDGSEATNLVAGPGLPIIGGHTEKFSAQIMGNLAQRSFVSALGRVFAGGGGPNIGPNTERMEVSMNNGITVIDALHGKIERHVALGFGVNEGMAFDSAANLLYIADIGIGRVHIYDAKALLADDTSRKARLDSIAIPPPAGFPFIRVPEDFAVHNRSGSELHSGPTAVALTPDGTTLYVLDRFTGTLAVIDTKTRTVRDQIPIAETLNQGIRRRGEILYHTDLGRSSMTCDTCHIEGHSGGVLFSKTRPLRIYRSPTVRGVRDTPPYFVPPNLTTLAATASFVGDRNRYHNPDLTPDEVSALAAYSALVTNIPNPFVDEGGAPPRTLTLPDAGEGHPRNGQKIFDAHCASCHPPPLFAYDQDEKTRGKLVDVGTPLLLAVRPQLQDRFFKGYPPPSLLGAWDVFPMFNTGSAGMRALPDGRVMTSGRTAIREVLSLNHTRHGELSTIEGTDRDDLYAYLLTL